MKKDNVRKWLVLALVFGLLIAACGTDPDPTDPPATDAPEPTMAADTEVPAPPAATPTEVDTTTLDISMQDAVSADLLLDPANTTDADSLMISGYIYEGLVTADGSPALAVSWTVSDDKLDWIFVLRFDAAFHDGTVFDADAVLANFNRWFDPDSPLRGAGAYEAWQTYFLGFNGETDDDDNPLSSFDGIEKVDNYTVLIHLNREVPDLLDILGMTAFSIASPTAIETDGAFFGAADGSAVGTGGYFLASWDTDMLVLVPNPDYWGSVADVNLGFPFE